MFSSTGTTDKTFQQFAKQDFFRHMLKSSSANLYESPSSHIFRTNTGIQPEPDKFDKLKLVTTFLPNLRVTKISCSFMLVLEREAGKDIPESSKYEFLEKFYKNSFAL